MICQFWGLIKLITEQSCHKNVSKIWDNLRKKTDGVFSWIDLFIKKVFFCYAIFYFFNVVFCFIFSSEMIFHIFTHFILFFALGNCVALWKGKGKEGSWPPPAKEGVPRDFFVDPKSSGKGDGKTKHNAFRNIQVC